MKLFDVPADKRVRITAKRICWVERQVEKLLVENVAWEGTTTNSYIFFKKVRRRLIVGHTLNFFPENGVWQSNCDCEIIEEQ